MVPKKYDANHKNTILLKSIYDIISHVKTDKITLVEQYLKELDDINARFGKFDETILESCLDTCEYEECTEFVELLLRYGANPEVCDGGRMWSAIQECAFNNLNNCLQLLLDHGANPNMIYNAIDDYTDNVGYTPLHLSQQDGHGGGFSECVHMLLNAGANPYALDNDGKTVYMLALGESEQADSAYMINDYIKENKIKKCNMTPFYIANNMHYTKFFNKGKLNKVINVTNNMHNIKFFNKDKLNEKDVKDVIYIQNVIDFEKIQPMINIERYHKSQMVPKDDEYIKDIKDIQNVIDNVVDIDTFNNAFYILQRQSSNMNTHYALEKYYNHILKLIKDNKDVQNFIDINSVDNDGNTALHLLFSKKYISYYEISNYKKLLKAGVNVGIRNNEGYTPLDVMLNSNINIDKCDVFTHQNRIKLIKLTLNHIMY